MNTEKNTTRMGSTTVTQTAEGFELKNGPVFYPTSAPFARLSPISR